MTTVEKIEELLQTTPSYLQHIVIQKWLIEQFIQEYKDLQKALSRKDKS